MKRFRFLVLALGILTFLSLTAQPSYAGCHHDCCWEGFGIALGGMALLGTLYAWTHPPVVAVPMAPVCPPPPAYACPPPRVWVPGHWEVTRTRRPGYWERVWIPGHYDACGRWVEGHYIRRHVPGRWVERRVWVPGYYQ